MFRIFVFLLLVLLALTQSALAEPIFHKQVESALNKIGAAFAAQISLPIDSKEEAILYATLVQHKLDPFDWDIEVKEYLPEPGWQVTFKSKKDKRYQRELFFKVDGSFILLPNFKFRNSLAIKMIVDRFPQATRLMTNDHIKEISQFLPGLYHPLTPLQKQLINGVKQDDFEEVKTTLAKGANINFYYETLLQKADPRTDPQALQYLESLKESIRSQKDSDEYQKVRQEFFQGSLAPVRSTYSIQTVLFEAINNHSIPLMTLLLEAGADARATQFIRKEVTSLNTQPVSQIKEEKNPLINAVEGGNKEMVELLLRYGANPDTMYVERHSYFSSTPGKEKEFTVELTFTPAISLATQFWVSARRSYYQGIVKTLLQYKANLNVYSKRISITFLPDGSIKDGYVRERTFPLNQATLSLNTEALVLFLQNGATLNIPVDGGRTVLHYAKSAKIVQLLLAHGADLYAEDSESVTPLYFMAEKWNSTKKPQYKEAIEALLSYGADPWKPNSKGKTAAGLLQKGGLLDSRQPQ